jgi:hypothetical protein
MKAASAAGVALLGVAGVVISLGTWLWPQDDGGSGDLPQPLIGTWNGSVNGLNGDVINLNLHQGRVGHGIGDLELNGTGCRSKVVLNSVSGGGVSARLKESGCRLIPGDTKVDLSYAAGKLIFNARWGIIDVNGQLTR